MIVVIFNGSSRVYILLPLFFNSPSPIYQIKVEIIEVVSPRYYYIPQANHRTPPQEGKDAEYLEEYFDDTW